MSHEMIVVVAEGCPHCKALLEKLPKENGKVKVLDVTKDLRAAAIVRDLGIYKVPLLVSVERTEEGTKLCTLDDEEMNVKCVPASPEALSEPATS
jgi:glutaredoxin